MMKNKKLWVITLSITLTIFSAVLLSQRVSADVEMTVYKSPTCGCCHKWIEHMEENGFTVKAVDVRDVNPVKQHYGINPNQASCHTALVEGYVVEGHVPASDVKRMLAEKPDILGLSVPGMPVGSPGMEMGDRVDNYSVMAIDHQGNSRVFNQY